jgi:hypothetical protein
MVENEVSNEEIVAPTVTSRSPFRGVIGALLVCVVFLGIVIVESPNRTSPPAAVVQEAEMLGMSNVETSVRACTLSECYSAACDHDVAPYICLRHNGGPHMGCSPVEWVDWSCDEQCSLVACDKIDIPKDTESCDGVKCTDTWCKSGQVCGADVPYQCTNGSARFGCSTDTFQWTLKVSSSTCSECCDATTCTE